jgi:membrane dipeptidase
MMIAKQAYFGYKSFDYLEKKDFRQFEIAEEMGWGDIEPYEVALTEAEEKRVEKILEENLVISLHDHVISLPKNRNEMITAIKECRAFTAYEALSRSCLDAVFDNQTMYIFFGAYNRGWKWDDCLYDLGMRLCDISHQNYVIVGQGIEDIKEAHKEGKMALIPAFESCTMIENEIDRLDVLYGFGVRMLGITYSDANMLGSGLNEKNDRGLTNFGYRVVQRLNKLGIAIDVAHCGDQTSLDVIEASEKPVFISHAGARSVWNTRRMVPDEVIERCASKGGVIGIEAAPHTTPSEEHKEQDIESFFDHVKYCIDLVGVDHVTFGPDTIYGDHCGLHAALSESFSLGAFQKKDAEQVPEIEYVKGLENPTECSNNVVRYLVKAGYSDEDIEKIIGGNTLRVLKEVWI